MQAILSYFWQICLLRVGPEKIPSNVALCRAICVVYLITQIVTTLYTRSDLATSEMIAQVTLSFAMEVSILFSLLTFKQLRERFLASLSALFGCNTIMLLLTLPINAMQLGLEDGIILDFFNTLYVMCLFWWFAIAGSIFHKSAQISLFQGIVIAISMELLIGFTANELVVFMRL